MFRRVATAEAPGIIARRLAPSENTMNPAVASLVILDTPFSRCMERKSREALFQAPANLRLMARAKLASAASKGDETVKALHNG